MAIINGTKNDDTLVGDLTIDLAVATLKTADIITIGPDIFVGA